MAKITFVDHHGEKRTVEIENGATVMEAAIRNGIPGIEAECGGACACATCHVYVGEDWLDRLPEKTDEELDQLAVLKDRRANSRLSCQVLMSEELDGIKVVLAPASRP